MAHECPECYSRCHCGGDIDDIEFPLDGYCSHCENNEDDEYDDYLDIHPIHNLMNDGYD